MNPLIINAAITGYAHTRNDNRNLPVYPDEIINDTVKCFKAGASIVHLHCYDRHGKPSWRSDDFKYIIKGIRSRCDIIISASTSGRLWNTWTKRSGVLNLPDAFKPELASITMGSHNFPYHSNINTPLMIRSLLHRMSSRNIKPELEIFEPGMINYARYLIKKKIIRDSVPYFNFITGLLGSVPATEPDLDHLIQSTRGNGIWSATGVGRFQYDINTMSIVKGGHVRVGLEDNVWFDNDRTIPATNEMLVKRLAAFSGEFGRRIATVSDTRRLLDLWM
jgi:uncharacterized protein (DUF849 family)